MKDDFAITIYKRINSGDKVWTFNQFLFNKLPPQKLYQVNRSYQRVLGWLKRDFCQGKLSSKVNYEIKNYLNWLWNNGKLDVKPSSCNPHFRRLGDYLMYYDGTIRNVKTQNTTVNPSITESGYATFNGKLVHRLMAEAWLHNPDDKEFTEVNHKDKNRSNNNIANLEWVSHEDNILHRDGKSYHAAPRIFTESRQF